MDILVVTQQGLSAQGNVECDVGEADSGVILQYDKESSDHGNKICLSDDLDEGVSSCSGKGMLKTLLWAWKRQLIKARVEMDRVLMKILEGLKVLGCSSKLGPIPKAFWVGRFKGRKAWACKSRPKSRFTPKPTAVVGFGVKPVLKLGIGAGLVLPDGASSIQLVDHPRKVAMLEATPGIGLGMTILVGVYWYGRFVPASFGSTGDFFFSHLGRKARWFLTRSAGSKA